MHSALGDGNTGHGEHEETADLCCMTSLSVIWLPIEQLPHAVSACVNVAFFKKAKVLLS